MRDEKEWTYRKILALLVEAIFSITARMLLILDKRASLSISDVDRNIAVITSELQIVKRIEVKPYLTILESGETNRKTVENIVRTKHLSLVVT